MDELVACHMPIIVRTARKNALNPGVELNDLVQTATEGLLIAINRWSFNKSDAAGNRAAQEDEDDGLGQAADPSAPDQTAEEAPQHASRLVTYAMWWMRTLLNDRVLEGRGMVARTKNRKTRTAFFALSKAKRALSLQTPLRASDVERIARHLGIDEHEVREAMYHAAGDVMLDEPVGDGLTSRGEIFADSRAESEDSILDRIASANTWNAVCAHLMTLRPRDRFVVITRYLLDTKWKLDHVSDVLKMSRERIRQICEGGLAEIRRAIVESGVKDTPARRAAAVAVQEMVRSIEAAAISTEPLAMEALMQRYGVLIGPSRGVNMHKAQQLAAPPRAALPAPPVPAAPPVCVPPVCVPPVCVPPVCVPEFVLERIPAGHPVASRPALQRIAA
jgi:DNA-directed RNA polymerase sigma subunit (sigma70/sigma32)